MWVSTIWERWRGGIREGNDCFVQATEIGLIPPLERGARSMRWAVRRQSRSWLSALAAAWVCFGSLILSDWVGNNELLLPPTSKLVRASNLSSPHQAAFGSPANGLSEPQQTTGWYRSNSARSAGPGPVLRLSELATAHTHTHTPMRNTGAV